MSSRQYEPTTFGISSFSTNGQYGYIIPRGAAAHAHAATGRSFPEQEMAAIISDSNNAYHARDKAQSEMMALRQQVSIMSLLVGCRALTQTTLSQRPLGSELSITLVKGVATCYRSSFVSDLAAELTGQTARRFDDLCTAGL